MILLKREEEIVGKVDGNDGARGSKDSDGRGNEKGEKARKLCSVVDPYL